MPDDVPIIMLIVVALGWAMPFLALGGGAWSLHDAPGARRRFLRSAGWWAAGWLVSAGFTLTFAASIGEGPAPATGACCLSVAGPFVGGLILVQASRCRADADGPDRGGDAPPRGETDPSERSESPEPPEPSESSEPDRA